MRKLIPIIFAIVLPIQALSKTALDEVTKLLIVQGELEAHGFNVGKPDGKMGSQTRAALEEYASRNGISPEYESVVQEMLRRNRLARVTVTDEGWLTSIKEGVSRDLRDPGSAEIRDVFKVNSSRGVELVCGEVNGKNAYGAYAGYVAFDGMMMMGKFALLQIDFDYPTAFYLCSLSYPN